MRPTRRAPGPRPHLPRSGRPRSTAPTSPWDEWGTVAAAATGLGFEESGPPPPELTVRADHPFLYVIRHRDSGLVLFTGQVTDPTS